MNKNLNQTSFEYNIENNRNIEKLLQIIITDFSLLHITTKIFIFEIFISLLSLTCFKHKNEGLYFTTASSLMKFTGFNLKPLNFQRKLSFLKLFFIGQDVLKTKAKRKFIKET